MTTDGPSIMLNARKMPQGILCVKRPFKPAPTENAITAVVLDKKNKKKYGFQEFSTDLSFSSRRSKILKPFVIFPAVNYNKSRQI